MRFKSVSALALAVLAMGVVASQGFGAAAQTWTVDDDAGYNNASCKTVAQGGTLQCATIQKAVTKASAGDTINVKPGLYPENVMVTKKLNIKSTKNAPDLLSCNDNRTDPDPTKYAVLDGTGPGGTGFDLSASGTTIDGFIIQNYATGIATYALYSGETMKNNLLQDNTVTAIQLESSGTTTVQGNCMRDNPIGTYTLDTLKSASIKQNHFWTQTIADVWMEAGNAAAASNTVNGSNSKNSAVFVYAANTSKLAVTGNIVDGQTDTSGQDWGAIWLNGSNATFTISGNIISNSAANGISVSVSGIAPFDLTNNGTISSNIVSKSGGDGLFVDDGGAVAAMTKTTVNSNIFQNNTDDGTHVAKQTTAITTAQKNTFTANINSNNPVHDCHDSNNKDVWTGNTNIGHRVNKTGLCFPGDQVSGPQNHAPF